MDGLVVWVLVEWVRNSLDPRHYSFRSLICRIDALPTSPTMDNVSFKFWTRRTQMPSMRRAVALESEMWPLGDHEAMTAPKICT